MTSVKFIRERPADSDRLGAHTRVATALSSIIQQQSTVRTIGLLGRWGSGKSTVINISRKIIEENRGSRGHEIKFFIYDAWVHQSDPQRQAFLESFVNHAKNFGAISENEFNAEIDRLTRRAETHDIHTTPTLTGWGTSLAVSLALVPIGVTVSRLDGNWSYVGVALAFAPLGVLLASKLWASVASATNARSAEKATAMAALFFNKTVDKVRTRISKPTEPTTSEFRDLFNRVVRRAKEKSIEFVIVFDNLDRISPEDAIVMWSSIKSLMDHDLGDASIIESFKVIVPFDNSSIMSIFSSKDDDFDPVKADEKAQSFIDKTFDATLVVGPPIDSDWREYLSSTLVEAFGDNYSQKQISTIVKVFECFVNKSSYIGVTPRRINSYANSLVSTWMQWGDQLSIASLAYYAARKLWGDPNLTDVFSSDAPGEALMSRLAPDWKIEVAAIHFGVAPQKARQLVLEPELERAAANGDQERFMALANIPGFGRTLENWLTRNKSEEPYSGLDPATLLNAASFAKASLEASGAWEDVSAAFREACSNLASWTFATPHARSGAEALRSSEFEPSRPLVAAMSAKSSTSLDPESWLVMVDAVLAPGANLTQVRELSVPFDAPKYVAMLEEASARDWDKSKTHILKRLSPKDPLEVVTTAISEMIPSAEPRSILNILKSQVHVDAKWSFNKISETASENIVSNIEVAIPLLECLILILDQSNDQLLPLGDNGNIAEIFLSATEAGDARAQAVSIIALLLSAHRHLIGGRSKTLSSPGWAPIRQFSIPEENYEEFFTSFVDIFYDYSKYNGNKEAVILRCVLICADLYPTWRIFAKNFIETIEARSNIGRRTYTEDIIEYTPLMRKLSGDDVVDHIATIASTYNTWEAGLAKAADKPFWSTVRVASIKQKEKLQVINDVAGDKISALSADNWADFIFNPPDYADDFCLSMKLRAKPDAKKVLTRGFEQWVTDYMSGERDIGLSYTAFTALFEVLPLQKRRLWAKAICDYIQHCPIERASRAIGRMGGALSRHGIKTQAEANLIATSVVLRIIVNKDESVRDEICNNWDSVLQILALCENQIRADIAGRQDFIETIATIRNTSPESIRNDLLLEKAN